VSFKGLVRALVIGAALLGGTVGMSGLNAFGQEESTRKAKSKVTPTYPELARRMKITGVVKVQAIVAPNGTVKDAKVVGGHPVLATAALDAVRKWRFEARPQETTENLEFHFDPSE